MDNDRRNDKPDANRDPLTGEPGSHPIGTGIGSAGGAAAGYCASAERMAEGRTAPAEAKPVKRRKLRRSMGSSCGMSFVGAKTATSMITKAWGGADRCTDGRQDRIRSARPAHGFGPRSSIP